jgi:urease accessory protein UreF
VMLTKASAVEEETKLATWLYYWCNQSIQLTEGVTVMSLSASLLQKINMHMNCVCKIALNRKLLRDFEKCCKFLSRIKAKLCSRSHN